MSHILTESGDHLNTEDLNHLITEGVAVLVSGGMIFPQPEMARPVQDDEDWLIMFHLNQIG